MGASRLTTYGPEHTTWGARNTVTPVRGHFYRLVPPPGTPDERIEAVKRVLYEGGARAVVVVPPAKAAVVLKDERPADSTMREVVQGIVDRANTSDREALQLRVDETCGKVGI